MDRTRSRIVVALDPPVGVRDSLSWGLRIINATKDLVAGYEVGLPMLIKAGGINGLARLINEMDGAELRIADLKLADISDMMIMSVAELVDIGFNAFTAHAFIGYTGALRELSDYLLRRNALLIGIVSMSQRGGIEFFDPLLNKLTTIALKADAWGLIAPATRPWVIRSLRRYLDSMGMRYVRILAPGVGVQGGRVGEALGSGADYEIIGRLVTRDPDPRGKVVEINKIHRSVLESREGYT